jgi:hypothetical protein
MEANKKTLNEQGWMDRAPFLPCHQIAKNAPSTSNHHILNNETSPTSCSHAACSRKIACPSRYKPRVPDFVLNVPK